MQVSDTNDRIELVSQSEPAYSFGILSLHLHGGEVTDASISQSNFVSIGCSDGLLRLISCDGDSYTTIEEIPLAAASDDTIGDPDAILYHDLNNCTNKAICGT